MTDPKAERLFSIVVLISGRGSNLRAILEHIENKQLPIQVCAVISNKCEAPGLSYAKDRGIPFHIIQSGDFSDRDSYDQQLKNCIAQYPVDLVVLAGYMRILSETFVEHFLGKLINIHPSLLPKFKGLNTHQRAIEARETHHGCSVHYVVPELDEGPCIAQAKYALDPEDSLETTKTKVHKLEHQLYPTVIQWIQEKRVTWVNNQLTIDPVIKDSELPTLT